MNNIELPPGMPEGALMAFEVNYCDVTWTYAFQLQCFEERPLLSFAIVLLYAVIILVPGYFIFRQVKKSKQT